MLIILRQKRHLEFRSIVGLYLPDRERECFQQLLDEVLRAEGVMLVVHLPETEPCTLVDRRILVVFHPIDHAFGRYIFHIDLHLLTGIPRPCIRLGLAGCALFELRVHPLLYHPQHTAVAACIAAFAQTIPKRYHIILVVRIAAQNHLFFSLCMLFWVMMRSVASLRQTFPRSIIPRRPIIHRLTADFKTYRSFCSSVFVKIFHYPLTKPCFLCYTIHGTTLFS